MGLARGVMRNFTAVKSYVCVSTWLLSCDCQICDLRTLRLQYVRQFAAEIRSAREDRGSKWTDDAAPMRELERKRIICESVHFTDIPVGVVQLMLTRHGPIAYEKFLAALFEKLFGRGRSPLEWRALNLNSQSQALLCQVLVNVTQIDISISDRRET